MEGLRVNLLVEAVWLRPFAEPQALNLEKRLIEIKLHHIILQHTTSLSTF